MSLKKARCIWYRVRCDKCGKAYKTMPLLWSCLRGVPPVFARCDCGGKVHRSNAPREAGAVAPSLHADVGTEVK